MKGFEEGCAVCDERESVDAVARFPLNASSLLAADRHVLYSGTSTHGVPGSSAKGRSPADSFESVAAEILQEIIKEKWWIFCWELPFEDNVASQNNAEEISIIYREKSAPIHASSTNCACLPCHKKGGYIVLDVAGTP